MLDRLADVFKSFQEREVRYVVIGGIAAVLYGVPRATFDLDVLIDPLPDNAQRLLAALTQAGLGTASLTTAERILANEITVFKGRVRVDILTVAPGLIFEQVWRERQTMSYLGQEFFVISKRDLIASKRASGRPVDLEDARLLELPEPPSS
jgi:hypothetical protein